MLSNAKKSLTKQCIVKQIPTESYRVIQSHTESYRVIQSHTASYRVMQRQTKLYKTLHYKELRKFYFFELLLLTQLKRQPHPNMKTMFAALHTYQTRQQYPTELENGIKHESKYYFQLCEQLNETKIHSQTHSITLSFK